MCKASRGALYDQLYCQRGEAENRIKETQLDLFGTRASCHKFLANQFRLLLAALAYTLMQRLRALALSGTELARACAATIRTRLLKIGVGVLRNTRRVRLMFASHHPLRETVRTGCGTTRRSHTLTATQCCPRHAINNGGRGQCPKPAPCPQTHAWQALLRGKSALRPRPRTGDRVSLCSQCQVKYAG